MSNDELGGLPPLENNPLGGDLLDDMSPLAESPLAAGGSLLDEEAAAVATAPLAGVAAEAEATPEEPEVKEKSPGLLSRLAASNPYTVMLFASLVALLIGVLCLLLEWRSYNFDTKAKEARQSARAAAPVDPAAGIV